MNDAPVPAAHIAIGAAAGLLAGLVGALAMDRFQALVQPRSDSEPATQKAADRLAVAVTGTPLARADKPLGGQAVHYGTGALLGLFYGIAAAFEPRVTAGAGTAFATGTWAVLDEAAVPAAGLGDAPWKAPPSTHAYGLASHLVFGFVAELTRRLGESAMARLAR